MKKQKLEKGTLYIVGTPIGNLSDITLRAIETLKSVDIILAEDTRQTLKLLNHLKIEKHMISYHRHNEAEKIEKVIALLDAGRNIALVSDAGMPIISDPGTKLIQILIQKEYNIDTIPGVTAITTAIVRSGLDSTRFTFEGFLSINKKQRKLRLESLKEEPRTMVFYEAPHKILATLKDLLAYLGNRKICIARELTKIYEEYMYVDLENAIDKINESGIKGEIVLMVEGYKEDIDLAIYDNICSAQLVKKEIEQGLNKKEAIKKVAKLKGVNKNEVYQECIEIEVE
ncbi:MAG: 16S rRNA (cytidine(1402)-2'-O)-methyltransferase [Clostridia bacterium]